VAEDKTGHILPVECLNTLRSSGTPPHELTLQKGGPSLWPRNLGFGLADATRMIVCRLGTRVVDAEVATGPLRGETTPLPRLTTTPP
jgi:hypothetical protein